MRLCQWCYIETDKTYNVCYPNINEGILEFCSVCFENYKKAINNTDRGLH
jgi:hypothetical protein